MKKSKTSYAVSAKFQQVFTLGIVAVFSLQTGWLLYDWISDYSRNPHVNGFEWMFIYHTALPVAVFLLAWILRPKQATQATKAFDSMLITIAGMVVYSLIAQISSKLYLENITPGSGYELSLAYNMAGAGTFLALYVATLAYLRKVRKWR